MKRILFFALLISPCFISAQKTINIIPQPVSLEIRDGIFSIDGATSVTYNSTTPDLAAAADFFSNYIRQISGYKLAVNKASKKSIQFSL